MSRMGLDFYVLPLPKRRAFLSGDLQETLLANETNWLRVPMYVSISTHLQTKMRRDFFHGKLAIEIGGSEGTLVRLLDSLGCAVEIAPEYPSTDVESLSHKEGSFDVVVLDQVLEHLKHPWKAVNEIRRVLRANGICICSSVFVYPVHRGFIGSFGDFFRFSPDGLRALFDGFEILMAEGWGNAQVIKLMYDLSPRGPEGPPPLTKEEAQRAGLYSYTDDLNYVMTWCIAQKT
jgi:SAM-dependent methyltransferase